MRTRDEVIRESLALLDKLNTNYRILCEFFPENSPDAMIWATLLEDIEFVFLRTSGIYNHYLMNSSN